MGKPDSFFVQRRGIEIGNLTSTKRLHYTFGFGSGALVNAVIAEHFEILIGDMLNKAEDERGGRKFFVSGLVIRVFCIVEIDELTVIAVNPGGSNTGAADVSGDIFDKSLNRMRNGSRGLGSADIETVRIEFVQKIGFRLKRRTKGISE